MDQKTRILKRADELIEEGQAVLATEHEPQNNGTVDHDMYVAWSLKVSTLVDRVERPGGPYIHALNDMTGFTTRSLAAQGLATLRGFRDDVANDMFVRVEDLVSADVFDDLLEQAEHLLEAGHAVPAAALAGAVLERELRVLANAAISGRRATRSPS